MALPRWFTSVIPGNEDFPNISSFFWIRGKIDISMRISMLQSTKWPIIRILDNHLLFALFCALLVRNWTSSLCICNGQADLLICDC